MSKLFPPMYDTPETAQSLGGLVCGSVSFFLLPLILTLFFFAENPPQVYMGLEYLYQGINFGLLFFVFRSYLRDSWLNVSIAPRKILGVSLGAAVAIFGIYAFYVGAGYFGLIPQANVIVLGAMPMTGVELMMVPGDLVILGGIPAMVFLTVLGPVITVCMFYASVFAPLCGSGKRFGAYAALAVILAVPRIITSFAVWGGWKELPLYLTQLPIHLLACWTYQKTDTVWTPIFTLAIANLLSCILLFGLQFVGIIA